MTYTPVVWYAPSARENVKVTAREMGNIDAALVDYETRITALTAALAALDARVVDLEEA